MKRRNMAISLAQIIMLSGPAFSQPAYNNVVANQELNSTTVSPHSNTVGRIAVQTDDSRTLDNAAVLSKREDRNDSSTNGGIRAAGSGSSLGGGGAINLGTAPGSVDNGNNNSPTPFSASKTKQTPPPPPPPPPPIGGGGHDGVDLNGPPHPSSLPVPGATGTAGNTNSESSTGGKQGAGTLSPFAGGGFKQGFGTNNGGNAVNIEQDNLRAGFGERTPANLPSGIGGLGGIQQTLGGKIPAGAGVVPGGLPGNLPGATPGIGGRLPTGNLSGLGAAGRLPGTVPSFNAAGRIPTTLPSFNAAGRIPTALPSFNPAGRVPVGGFNTGARIPVAVPSGAIASPTGGAGAGRIPASTATGARTPVNVPNKIGR